MSPEVGLESRETQNKLIFHRNTQNLGLQFTSKCHQFYVYTIAECTLFAPKRSQRQKMTEIWTVLTMSSKHDSSNKYYILISCASAKAERSLSSLSCVWMYVDHFWVYPPMPPPLGPNCLANWLATPPPLEMTYQLGIPWFQVQIRIHHKNLA